MRVLKHTYIDFLGSEIPIEHAPRQAETKCLRVLTVKCSRPDVVGEPLKSCASLHEDSRDHGAAPVRNETAAELGHRGGKERAETMTPEWRAEIAERAAGL